MDKFIRQSSDIYKTRSNKKKILYGFLVLCVIGGIIAAIVLTRHKKVEHSWSCQSYAGTTTCMQLPGGIYPSKESCMSNCQVQCRCTKQIDCGNVPCCNGDEYTWESPEYFSSQFTITEGETTEFVSQPLSKYMMPNRYFKWAKNVKYDCGKGNILSFHNDSNGGGTCNGAHTTCGCCPYDYPIYMGSNKCCPNGTTSINNNMCMIGSSTFNPIESYTPTENPNWKGNVSNIDSLDDNLDGICDGLCKAFGDDTSKCINIGKKCVSKCEYPPNDILPISLSTQYLNKEDAIFAFNQAVPCDLNLGNISSNKLNESIFASWSESVNNTQNSVNNTFTNWVCDGLQSGQYLKDNTGKLWICQISDQNLQPNPVYLESVNNNNKTQITLDILTGNTNYKPIDGNVKHCLKYLYNTTNKGNTDACNVSYTATDNLLQSQMLKNPPSDLKDLSAKLRYNANVSESICGNSTGCEWVSFIDSIGNTNGICVTK